METVLLAELLMSEKRTNDDCDCEAGGTEWLQRCVVFLWVSLRADRC